MNADDRVEVRLRHSKFEADGDALSDLSSVRGAHMETDDTIVVSLVGKNLGVRSALSIVVICIDGPLERLEARVPGVDVLSAVALLGLLFSQANAAVL